MEREDAKDPVEGIRKVEASAPVTDTAARTHELSEQALDKVAGGVRGGDDDLEDLEVERLR